MACHVQSNDEAMVIIAEIVQQTDADRGCILLKNEAGRFTFAAGENLTAAEMDTVDFKLCWANGIDVVLASGDPVVTTNAASDAATRKHQDRMRAILCAPLLHYEGASPAQNNQPPTKNKSQHSIGKEQEMFGVIYIDCLIPSKIFTSRDLRPFVRLAAEAAQRLR